MEGTLLSLWPQKATAVWECSSHIFYLSVPTSQSLHTHGCMCIGNGRCYEGGDLPGPTKGHLHRFQTPLSLLLLVHPPLAHLSRPGRQEMKIGWVSGTRCTRQWWAPRKGSSGQRKQSIQSHWVRSNTKPSGSGIQLALWLRPISDLWPSPTITRNWDHSKNEDGDCCLMVLLIPEL